MEKFGSIIQLWQKAFQLYQEGLYSQAAFFTRQILNLRPNQADAGKLLDLISQQFDVLFADHTPSSAVHQANYYHSMAILCRYIGGITESLSLFRRAIELNPDDAAIINHFGEALRESGQVDEAISCYKQAIEKRPDYAQAYNNLGNAVQAFRQYGQSVLYYKKAVSLQADYVEAYQNWGYVLRCQGYSDKAIPYYQKSVRINPNHADGWLGLGDVYFDLGQITEAQESYCKAIEINPALPQAYNALGIVLREFGDLGQAVSTLMKAVDVKPDYVIAFVNLGQAYRLMNRLGSARHAYQQALQIDPDNPMAVVSLSLLLQEICAWTELDTLRPRLQCLVRQAMETGELSPESALTHIVRYDDPALNLAVARSWSRFVAKKVHRHDPFQHTIAADGWSDPTKRQGRIRLGYLANVVTNHPLLPSVAELFRCHDRHRFEVFCYVYGGQEEGVIPRLLAETADHLIDLHTMSFNQAAERIHADQINILIDVAGHTRNNRMEICALRPAPVQISYMGFPGSSGADFMDYLIADKVVIPECQQPHYQEKVLYLPHCYQFTRGGAPVSTKIVTRSDYGLPPSGFVFGSVLHFFKIDADLFKIWMTILASVPGSVLWLNRYTPLAEENLREMARRLGIDVERLIFSRKERWESREAQLQLVDLVLDARLCNGQVGSRSALQAGIPVLTWEGRHFASRIGSSMLQALGVPELIAHSAQEYQSLAIQLALHPEKLVALRKKMVECQRNASPLFDSERGVRDLETLLEEVWRGYLCGVSPAPRQGP